MSKAVDYDGLKLLDGGISDPLPLRKSISDGHIFYNKLIDELKNLVNENKVFLIEPSEDINIGPIYRNLATQEAIYNLGYTDGLKSYKNLMGWIEL